MFIDVFYLPSRSLAAEVSPVFHLSRLSPRVQIAHKSVMAESLRKDMLVSEQRGADLVC